MAAAAWKTLRSAVEDEDWSSFASTLQEELRCESASDLVSILRATIDEVQRRKDNKGRGKAGKDKAGKGSRGKGGGYNIKIDLDPVASGFNMIAKLLGTSGQNVHHVQDQTGAQVELNREDGQATSFEISADSRGSLDKAKRLTEELIGVMFEEYDDWAKDNGVSGRKGSKGKSGGKSRGKSGKEGKKGRKNEDGDIEAELELEEFDPAFGFRAHLVGEKGKNVHHIEDTTSAKVNIEQPDSRGPITIKVIGQDDSSVNHALKLCKDLVNVIKEDYQGFLDDGGAGKKGKSKGKGGKKGDRESSKDQPTESIEVQGTDAAFDMKGKIIGDKGRHVHHVQDETGAKVWVDQTDKGEPITIRISARSQEAVDKALNLCQDLVDACNDEYQEWISEGEGQRKGSKGKGKGKGKRREREDEDEPSSKRART
jgi:transcription antitermination factor NusA-like protein